MKKSVLAVLTAAMVLSMSTITAFAAPSGVAANPVAGQEVATDIDPVATPELYDQLTEVSEGFEETAVAQTTVNEAAVAVQNLFLNNVEAAATFLQDKQLAAAAKDPGKKVTATVRTVVEISPTTAVKGADGYYTPTIKSNLFKAGHKYAALHQDKATKAWNAIVVTKVADGEVTVKTADLSPIAIVELTVTGTATSPKTGEELPVAMMIVLLGVAGAVVCGRKVFA